MKLTFLYKISFRRQLTKTTDFTPKDIPGASLLRMKEEL